MKMLAASSIHGTMALFQDRITDRYEIAYWQVPPDMACETTNKTFMRIPQSNPELGLTLGNRDINSESGLKIIRKNSNSQKNYSTNPQTLQY